MNNKRWALVIAGLLVFLLGGLAASQTADDQPSEDLKKLPFTWTDKKLQETVLEEGDSHKKIVVLPIHGTIQPSSQTTAFSSETYDHEAILETIDQIKSDPDVSGLLLDIDSPGGSVYECLELHQALLDLKKEKDLPIYASMKHTAASGGLMAAMAADTIYAKPETLTGSIGVIMSSPNLTGLNEKLGIEWKTYKTGPHKDMGSAYREPTPEDEKLFNDIIQESYQDFVQLVADGRGMPLDQVKKLADGRVYTGRQAKANHLIDELGGQDEALEAMKQANHLEGAQVVEKTKSKANDMLSKFFTQLDQTLPKSNAQVLRDLQAEYQAPRPLYLYGGE